MHRTIRNFSLLGSVFLITLLGLLFSRYRLKARANRALEQASEQRERAARAELTHFSLVNIMGELATVLAHVLRQPLTYLSEYHKPYGAENYNRPNLIRTRGDWDGWLGFFLRGVFEVSEAAAATIHAILRLREEVRETLRLQLSANPNALNLLDRLFERPVVSVNLIAEWLGCTYPTASTLVEQFVKLGLLRETTGRQRDRRYQYDQYLALFGVGA